MFEQGRPEGGESASKEAAQEAREALVRLPAGLAVIVLFARSEVAIHALCKLLTGLVDV